MRFTITGRNMEVSSGLRAAIEEKLGKLEHYFTPTTEVIVTLSIQRGEQKIEVTIPIKGGIIRAEEASSDMYVSIDLVEEVIERQVRRYKKKIIDRKQSAQSFSQLFLESDEPAEDEEINIVKTKRFGMKDMNVMDCVECRCCEYICSSKIPLVSKIKAGKNAVRGMK